MISNDERREVARRLRGLDHVVTNYDTIESGVNKFIKAVYGDRPYSPIECSTRNLCGLAMTLADLIERPTCFDTESNDSKSFTCSACGFSESKLVISPFTLSFLWVKPSYRYCPNCGAEVVE